MNDNGLRLVGYLITSHKPWQDGRSLIGYAPELNRIANDVNQAIVNMMNS